MIRTTLLLLVLGSAHTAARAGVPNPSVEVADSADAALPASWSRDAWGGIGARFTWGQGARHGLRMLRVEVTAASSAGDAKWLSASFLVDTGAGKYMVSDWYRSSVESHLMIIAADAAGRRRAFIEVASLPAAATWAEARGQVAIPPWAASLRVMHRIARPGWLETDRFVAERVPGPGATPRPAVVSLTFDDGWRSAFMHLVPRVEAMGWRSTQYLVSDFIDDPRLTLHHLTSKEVRDLIARGHEIGSHGRRHEDLTRLSSADVAAELDRSKAALQGLGAQVTSFAPPYGAYTHAVREQAMRSYAAFRTVNGGIHQTPYPTHELKAVDVASDLPLARIESYIDQAENLPGGWLILVFHRAAGDGMPAASTHISPDKFQALLDLLKARRAVVKPVGEVLGLWTAPAGGPAVASEVTASPAGDGLPRH